MRRKLKCRAIALCAAVGVLPAGIGLSATSRTWVGNLFTVINWSDPSNWSPVGVPQDGDSASILGSGIFGIGVYYDYAGAPVTLTSLTLDETPSTTTFTPEALITMQANNLSSNYEYVGDSGTPSSASGMGEIDQSGGTNTITAKSNSALYLGFGPNDTGTYNLSGGAILNATNIFVGQQGTGTFTQTGGTCNVTELTLANFAGHGTYNLGGNGVLNAGDEAIGYTSSGVEGFGAFLQTGGVNSSGSAEVGGFGEGSYTQLGGVANIAQLTVGRNENGDGIYTLDAGSVSCTNITLGVVTEATFNQSGGICTANSLAFGLAAFGAGGFGSGNYNLSGNGMLVVSSSEVLGEDGSGAIMQSGGTNQDEGMLVIPEANDGRGSYDLIGGTASAQGTQIGSVTSSTGSGEMTISGSGVFTDPVIILLQQKGTLTLSGGTLNAAAILLSGGTFSWTSGTLNFIGAAGLTIDGGQLFGNNASITPGKILGVTATLTNNGTFTSTSQVSVGSVTNVGTFTSEGALTVANSFTNSGLAVLGGVQSWAAGSTFSNTAGGAAFQTDAGSASSSTLSVNISGGNVTLGSPQHWAGLTISGGILDIENDHLIISYGATDPKSLILSYLKSGSNGGTWTGATGILSFAAAISSGHYGVGFADGADHVAPGLTSGQIEVAYTLNGDATLQGIVNGTDFSILAGNFGKSVTGGWEQGDFNYDGVVNGQDFGLLAANFGKSDSGADIALPSSDWAALDSFASVNGLTAFVPEPGTWGAGWMIAGALMLHRRRRARRRTSALTTASIS